MKYFLLLLFGFSIIQLNAQDLSKRDIKKLNNFGINQQELNLESNNVNTNLNTLLIKDRKRKTNKTLGIILTSLSAITITAGVTTIVKTSNSDGAPFGAMAGGAVAGFGIIEGLIAIPLFKASKKRKSERDKLIEKYHTNLK